MELTDRDMDRIWSAAVAKSPSLDAQDLGTAMTQAALSYFALKALMASEKGLVWTLEGVPTPTTLRLTEGEEGREVFTLNVPPEAVRKLAESLTRPIR
jgi:hypothetical protein